MYFFSLSVIDAANSIGVKPLACTSFSNGREIFPSGRTGNVSLSSGSCHTVIRRVSSVPITYVSCAVVGGVCLSGAAAVGEDEGKGAA